MAFSPDDADVAARSLATIVQWANAKRGQGLDPYALSSSNGNQGLDAMLAQAGVSLPQFNQGAIALGVAFTQGTSWLRTYATALQAALGVQGGNVTAGAGGGGAQVLPSLTSDNWQEWALYAGVGAVALMIFLRTRRRR